jgi:tetratricopeptide (TPR) repeat protein
MHDIFAVQAEVGERTAASLRIRLMGGDRAALSKAPTAKLGAYGPYLQGLHMARELHGEGDEPSLDLFRRAAEADPTFAPALSQWAHRLLESIGDSNPAHKVLPEVRRLVEKALALDPHSAEAHSARANLAMQGDLNWAIADVEYRRSIELNPSLTDTRIRYAMMLRALPRYSDAEDQVRAVIELDPLNWSAYSFLVSLKRLTGDYEEVVGITRTSLRRFLSPAKLPVTLAYSCMYAGRKEDALTELEEAKRLGLVDADNVVLRARLGDPGEARSRLEEAEKGAAESYVSPISLAVLAASIADVERAIAYLEKDWSEGDRGIWFLYQGVAFDGVRSDPRFIKMLERARLPTSAPFYREGRVA